MRFSIVTISFNQARFLEQAIRSVVEEDYHDVEYIVVDPGSTDGSRAIIEKYRSRISKIIFEPDAGPADGLNKGFACATGEIYGYLNSDDYLLPGALARAAHCFHERNVDVVIGHSIVVDELNRVRRYHYSDRFDLTAYAYGQSQVMQASTFLGKSAFDTVDGFNPDNRSSWDGELMVELGLAGARFATVNHFFSAFRVYPESISGSGKLRDLLLRDHERLFARIMGREPEPQDKRRELWWQIRKHLLNPRNALQRLVRGPVCAIRDRRRMSQRAVS